AFVLNAGAVAFWVWALVLVTRAVTGVDGASTVPAPALAVLALAAAPALAWWLDSDLAVRPGGEARQGDHSLVTVSVLAVLAAPLVVCTMLSSSAALLAVGAVVGAAVVTASRLSAATIRVGAARAGALL